VFFGFETDTALAIYLFVVIDRAIATEAVTFKAANPALRGVRLRRASASFQHGVAARMSARLDAMHDAREASVRAQRSTGTASSRTRSRKPMCGWSRCTPSGNAESPRRFATGGGPVTGSI
jgi:hypothetical protein